MSNYAIIRESGTTISISTVRPTKIYENQRVSYRDSWTSSESWLVGNFNFGRLRKTICECTVLIETTTRHSDEVNKYAYSFSVVGSDPEKVEEAIRIVEDMLNSKKTSIRLCKNGSIQMWIKPVDVSKDNTIG